MFFEGRNLALDILLLIYEGILTPTQLPNASEHLAEDICVEALAALVELSPFHFSRVFKQTTGMSPLQFVTRERITRAQQLIRETSRSVIEIGIEVGVSNPSHFAKVFRKVVGVTQTEFRSALKMAPWPRSGKLSYSSTIRGIAFHVGETAARCFLRELSFRHCSALRVERSVARDPLRPSAATTNAALAGDLDDVPLGTPKEAPALFQPRF
jgi:AraC-like DNA-binding protein